MGGSEEHTTLKKQTLFSNKLENDEENLVTSDIKWVQNSLDFDKKCQSNREVRAARPFLEEEKLNET